ncbi:MAG TPA: hypothetical protein PK522_00865 [Nitrosomonas sp.]|nr:hypothetical protein [Nitrosomonas sp.]
MKTNPNDLAYPLPNHNFTDKNREQYIARLAPGLTKREYFAAMAMQGLNANGELVKALAIKGDVDYPGEFIATMACNSADALIDELNKEK